MLCVSKFFSTQAIVKMRVKLVKKNPRRSYLHNFVYLSLVPSCKSSLNNEIKKNVSRLTLKLFKNT